MTNTSTNTPDSGSPVQRLVGHILNSPDKNIVLRDVSEYAEWYPVKLYRVNERIVINATNQGGHDGTEVDLIDLILWIRANFPELLSDSIPDAPIPVCGSADCGSADEVPNSPVREHASFAGTEGENSDAEHI